MFSSQAKNKGICCGNFLLPRLTSRCFNSKWTKAQQLPSRFPINFRCSARILLRSHSTATRCWTPRSNTPKIRLKTSQLAAAVHQPRSRWLHSFGRHPAPIERRKRQLPAKLSSKKQETPRLFRWLHSHKKVRHWHHLRRGSHPSTRSRKWSLFSQSYRQRTIQSPTPLTDTSASLSQIRRRYWSLPWPKSSSMRTGSQFMNFRYRSMISAGNTTKVPIRISNCLIILLKTSETKANCSKLASTAVQLAIQACSTRL